MAIFHINFLLLLGMCNSPSPVKKSLSEENLNSVCGVQTAKQFLHWYKIHFDEITRIQLVDMACSNSQPKYRVNSDSTKKYFEILNTSKYFSKEYFEEQEKYFQLCNTKMIEENQSDGPPFGFESDLIFFSQEPEEILNNIDRLRFEVNNSQNGNVEVKMFDLDHIVVFELTSNKEQCLIKKMRWAPLN